MSTLEQRLRLANLIEDVVGGRISVEAAFKLTKDWNDIPWREKKIDVAWHTLKHFEIDEDIRARDERYDKGLKEGLLKLAALLKTDD